MTNAVDVEPIRAMAERAGDNIGRVIVGKRDVIDLLLVALLCEGHVLIEDVPGIGKTMLARSVARTLDCSFRRIQFTPDLLPSDITGVSFFNQRTQEFEFRPGPIFAQVVLADEINRATPRTQSAMLECMEERQVSLEGETRALPRPFLVLATQNPIELEGTFPLPEAQLDRFLLRLSIGYPSESDEKAIVRRFRAAARWTSCRRWSSGRAAGHAAAGARGPRCRGGRGLHRAAGARVAAARRDRARRQPAGDAGAVSRRAGAGRYPRARLRVARRREAACAGGAHPSSHHQRPVTPARPRPGRRALGNLGLGARAQSKTPLPPLACGARPAEVLRGEFGLYLIGGVLVGSFLLREAQLFVVGLILLLVAVVSWVWQRYCLVGLSYRRGASAKRLVVDDLQRQRHLLAERSPAPGRARADSPARARQ